MGALRVYRRDPALLEEWVRGVYDTRSDRDLSGIAHSNEDGTSRSYHVTDAPDRVLAMVRRGPASFVASYGKKGARAELGPGLYVGNPAVWSGRSSRKWGFLDRLDDALYDRLAAYLHQEIDRDPRLTERERAYALRAIASREPGFLVGTLANLPYGIAFWQPSILAPLGITPSALPSILAIDFRGRYAELAGSYPPATILRQLRRMGFGGVFTKAGMGTNAELVIWNRRDIVASHVDDPILERPARDPSQRKAYR